MDWDGNPAVDPSEVLDNVTISFENLPDIIPVMTNESGRYEVFLEVDESYEVNISSDFPIKDEGLARTPTMTNTVFDFEITPENLTLIGSTKKDDVPQDFTALWFIKKCIRKLNALGKPAILYIHPWELDKDIEKIKGLPFSTKFITYYNIKNNLAKLEALLKRFDFCSIQDFFHNGGYSD